MKLSIGLSYKMDSLAKRGFLGLMVLAEVKKKPQTTYELIKSIQKAYGFRPYVPTIYITTKLLEVSGFVKSTPGRSSSRYGKIISITEKGEDFLKDGVSSLLELCKRLST